MPRPVTKTYGRNGSSANTSKAFDDAVRRASGRDKVFNDNSAKNSKMSTAMASTHISRFGKTSFTSTRSTPELPAPESRKRRAEEPAEPGLFDDPFSFDSDDDGPTKPKKGMGFKKKGRGGKGDVVRVRGSDSSSRNSSDTESNGKCSNIDPYVAPTAVTTPKTFSRGYTRTKVAATAAVAEKSSSLLAGKKQQSSMDTFMMKVNSTTTAAKKSTANNSSVFPSDNIFSTSTSLTDSKDTKKSSKQQQKKAVVHKFFTSKNSDLGSPEDHNYSADLSRMQVKMRDEHSYSQPERGTDSPLGDSVWSSDYDSDWDAESGDPEIVFNSPKKKLLAAQKQENLVKVASVNAATARSLQSEVARSPITVSSEPEEDARSACSIISAKSNKTDNTRDPFDTTRNPFSDDEEEESTFSTVPRRTYGKAVTYGRKTKCGSDSGSSVSSTVLLQGKMDSEATSLSQGQGEDLYSGIGNTRRAAPLPGLKKYSSLQEKETQQKKSDPAKPLIRRLLTSPQKTEGKPKKAIYNPRSWQVGSEGSSAKDSQKSAATSSVFDDDFDDEDSAPPAPSLRPGPAKQPAVLKRSVRGPTRPWDDEVSSLKVTREHKPLFTVVRNVKQAHECQEHGETQEFEDDIIYILQGVRDSATCSTRCLSTISLAAKCTMPAFRMHLRAHNTLTKVFNYLQDAPKYPTLALCTAAIMYIMSRDRLTMDLEQSTLQLMLALLSVDSQQMAHCDDRSTQTEYDRLCSRVCDITQAMRKNGDIKNKMLELELEDVSIGHLAMETLLSLTSKSAGDWFKDELRTHGGLDHIINTVGSCAEELDDYVIEPTDAMLENFSKIDRCLRVLENVTYLNSDNQTYLLSYKSSLLVQSCYKTIRVCENCMPFNRVAANGDEKANKDCPGYTIYSCGLSVLRVLLNLTHDNTVGCSKTGQTKGLIPCILTCILRVPQYVPVGERFDILVLGLGLLINMVEHCDGNKNLLRETQTVKPYTTLSVVNTKVVALQALSLLFSQCYELFSQCYEAARLMEEEHDAELEERERQKDGRVVATTTAAASQDSATSAANKSGEWKESDGGLEWVAVPADEEEDAEQILEKGGTLRDALRSHYNQDDFSEAGDDSDDNLEVIPGSQDEDENFTKTLHKYGRHMEDSIVAAYVALLLGVMIEGDSYLATEVQDYMSGCSFDGMIRMLKKFLGFMNFTSSTSNTGSKSIKRVIEILESYNDS